MKKKVNKKLNKQIKKIIQEKLDAVQTSRKAMGFLKRFKMKMTERTIPKDKKIEKYIDATKKKHKLLKQKECDLLRKTIYLNNHYTNLLIKIISDYYNYYGGDLALQLITNIVCDFTKQTVNPEEVDGFFEYLKQSALGEDTNNFFSTKEPEPKIKKPKKTKRMNYFG